VALSAIAGHLFSGVVPGAGVLLVGLGVGLLAMGCSALNQWQEQDLDARMERTCQRPLPAGELTATNALLLALSGIGIGLLLLGLLTGWLPLLLGILATIWYNGIYTPLKRRTPFAALPGAVCGALPPLIGWAASGEAIFSPPALILAGTLFLWQIPHTWLLLCRYRRDLRRSGLPDLFEAIPLKRLLQINHCWLVALAICYFLFPLFGMIENTWLANGYLGVLAALMIAAWHFLGRIDRLFHLVNLSMAVLLLTLICDNLAG
jgi:protoheme IX farnesyltransferase